MKDLDYKRMVSEIDKLVNNDAVYDLTDGMMTTRGGNTMVYKEFTQEQAEELSELIGKVYLIAHCIYCEACQTKYLTKKGDKDE